MPSPARTGTAMGAHRREGRGPMPGRTTGVPTPLWGRRGRGTRTHLCALPLLRHQDPRLDRQDRALEEAHVPVGDLVRDLPFVQQRLDQRNHAEVVGSKQLRHLGLVGRAVALRVVALASTWTRRRVAVTPVIRVSRTTRTHSGGLEGVRPRTHRPGRGSGALGDASHRRRWATPPGRCLQGRRPMAPPRGSRTSRRWAASRPWWRTRTARTGRRGRTSHRRRCS